MLDIKRIRDHEQTVRDGLSARGEDTAVIDRILELDAQRRARLNEVESLKNRRNAVSKEIGARKKAGEDTSAVQAETRQLGEQITVLDTEMRANEERLGEQLLVDADRRVVEGRATQLQHLALPNNAEVGMSAGDHCLLLGGAHRLSP